MNTAAGGTNRRNVLLQEEVASLEELRETLQAEWNFLRSRDLPSLIALLPRKQEVLSRLKKIGEAVRQEGSQSDGGESPPSLVPREVPPLSPAPQKMAGLQTPISRLKQEIRQTNERNKRFTRENLEFIRSLLSLLTGATQDPSGYAREGRKSLPPAPRSTMICTKV